MVSGLVMLWTDWGRRAAVIAGACVALVSLTADCPLWVACARGGATLVAVALIVHWIARLLAWSSVGDREEALARVTSSERGRAETKEHR